MEKLKKELSLYNKNNIRYIRMLAGTLLLAMAYKWIFDPAGMVTGGFSGIAVILRRTFGMPLWLTTFILNIPVFIAAYISMGRDFVKNTLAATAMLTVFLAVLPENAGNVSESDYLLDALFGGGLAGAGIGLVLTSMATTGGTDMIAAMLNRLLPFYSIAQIMQILDAVIVLAGALIFGIYSSMYSIIAIYVMSKVSDRICDGMKAAKAVYVISDKYEQIAKKIIIRLRRGGTYLYGEGIYSGNKKSVILCIMTRKQVPAMKKVVWETDEDAFIMVSDVREALGEGFVKNSQ